MSPFSSVITVSSPEIRTPAFITGCLCISNCTPGGMVIFRIATSGFPAGQEGRE